MWRKLFGWLIPRPVLQRRKVATRRGAITETHEQIGIHFHFNAPATVQRRARKAAKAQPGTGHPLLNALLGKPTKALTATQVRALPVARDAAAAQRQATLAEVEAVTGVRYAGRLAVQDGRAIQRRQAAFDRETARRHRAYERRERAKAAKAAAKAKPVPVDGYTRPDGKHVASYRRDKPGEGTTTR